MNKRTYTALLSSAALLISACVTADVSVDMSSDYVAANPVLAAKINAKPNRAPAKNLILFIGDGMGVSTVTAARIFEGQQLGKQGEEHQLSWESFPYTALSKTYNTNQQVSDSAGTASAMYTGVKTKAGALSVGPNVARGSCKEAKETELTTFWDAADESGMRLGLVSTARLTHATPAAAYAHSSERNWEHDGELNDFARDEGCQDIAAQFVEGNMIDVALGGGRRAFFRNTEAEPGLPDTMGRRSDGINLVEAWKEKNPGGEVAYDKASLDAISETETDRVLGLFDSSHMDFAAAKTGPGRQPTIAELTEKAIKLLSADGDGFVLMVEGGRIDHAHHGGNAFNALSDTVAFAEAVAVADAMTSDDDTTIMVTADHSHVFTMAGYPTRGNPILGLVYGNDDHGEAEGDPVLARDGKPYTTLGYANGPGALVEGVRPTLTDEEVADPFYRQQATVPTGGETHAGEDVAIYAKGPRAYVISGVVEQSFIHDAVRYALDLED